MSVFSTLLGPILTLWIGALVFYIMDRFFEPQDQGVAEAVVLVLGVGFLFGAHSQMNYPIHLGKFPTDVGWLGIWPFLVAEEASWLLALILLGGALVASSASLGRHTDGRAGRLATLGAALLFLFAGDWATLALAWALVDVCLLYTLGRPREQVESLGWAGVLSLGGAIILGVASLLWQQAGGGVWVGRGGALPVEVVAAAQVATTGLPPRAAALLVLASLLRLMPFPLPMWQAVTWRTRSQGNVQRETRPIARVVVFAIPTLLGAYLCMRLAQWDVMAQSGLWLLVLPIWAGLGLLVGAVKAWGAHDPDELISCASIYGGASILLGAGLNLSAVWQLVVGVNVLLSISVLFVSWFQCQYFDVSNPRSYWRAVPTSLVLLSLAGLPLTVGFPARVVIYWSVFAAEKWLLLLLLMVAEAVTLGALLRIVFDVESMQDDEGDALRDGEMSDKASGTGGMGSTFGQRLDWRREISYGSGAVLAGGVMILGIAPGLLSVDGSLGELGRLFGVPTLPTWAALLLPLVGAVVLYRYQDVILALMEEWWPLMRCVFHFDWIYRAIGDGVRQVGALIWGGSRVVEGAGYMAWVVLACLIILLFVIAR